MNVSHLLEDTRLTDFMTQWAKWQIHKKYYPNNVWWWCGDVKLMIRKFFIHAGTTRSLDQKQLEDFYYSTIYALLTGDITDQTNNKLRHLKAKIVRLHTKHDCHCSVDVGESDTIENETPSLYQLMRQRK
jgi:hypothetical protein